MGGALFPPCYFTSDFPGGSDSKVSTYNVGGPGSIPGLGRSLGEGSGNPLEYSCLKIPWIERPGTIQPIQRVRHDSVTSLSFFLSVQFSHSVMSDSLQPEGFPVHYQFPEFTQTHVHWVGDTTQPSHPVIPFSSCLQSIPASGSFPVSQFFTSGGQSIGVSASASVLPINIQDWFQLWWK